MIEQFFDVVRKNNLTDVLSVPFFPLRPSALLGRSKPTIECPSSPPRPLPPNDMPSALPHALTRVTVQIAKLCHIYIISNFEDEFVGWEDWDFDLEFYEFCEALARHGTGPSIPIVVGARTVLFAATEPALLSRRSALPPF